MVEIKIAPIQLVTLKSVIEFEIKTEGKAKLMRESALSAYKRLIADKAGIKVGRGQKGRYEALAVVEELLEQTKDQPLLPQHY